MTKGLSARERLDYEQRLKPSRCAAYDAWETHWKTRDWLRDARVRRMIPRSPHAKQPKAFPVSPAIIHTMKR